MLGMMVCLLMSGACKAVPVCAANTKVTLDVKSGQDITWELQEALYDARDNTSGTYTITIPKGKYKLSNTLKVYSNTRVVMNGVTLVRQSTAEKAFAMVRFDSLNALEAVGGVTGYSGFKNITFEGGTWDGNGENGAIMRLGHAKKITLKNVTFTNVKDTHHVEMAACKDVLVTGCTFKNFKGSWESTTNCEALQFDIMRSNHFSGYPQEDETPCKNITVTGCTFSHVQRGVGTHSAVAGSYFEKMTFSNNTFEDVAGYAIICTNYKNSTIKGNVIKNAGSGIFFRTMNKNYGQYFTSIVKKRSPQQNMNSVISGNTIEVTVKAYGKVAYGIELYGENLSSQKQNIPKGNYLLEGMTVSNNKITLKCRGYGMRLTGVNKSTFSGNSIILNITKNNKSGGNGDGIRMQNCIGNTISGNSIENKKVNTYSKDMCGICILDNSNNTFVKGNTITGCSVDGIQVRSSTGVKLQANKITNNGKYGIEVKNQSTVKTSGNTLKNNKAKDIQCSTGSTVNGKSKIG